MNGFAELKTVSPDIDNIDYNFQFNFHQISAPGPQNFESYQTVIWREKALHLDTKLYQG